MGVKLMFNLLNFSIMKNLVKSLVMFLLVLGMANSTYMQAEANTSKQLDAKCDNNFNAWKDCNIFSCWNFIDCNCNYQRGRKLRSCGSTPGPIN